MLDGLITDQVGADMHRLAAINSFFAGGYASAPSSSGLAYRESRGRRPYRRIRYAFVARASRASSGEQGELGRAGRALLPRALRRAARPADPDAALLGRVLAGGGQGRGELLSYLFFDPDFVHRLIDAGRADVQRWLDRHARFWCADSAHDFDLDPGRATQAAELARLAEWRALRRP